MVTMKSQDSDDYYRMDIEEEKQRLLNIKHSLKRRHSDSTVLVKDPANKNNNHPPDLSALHEIERDSRHDHDDYAADDRPESRASNYSQMSYFSHLSTISDIKEEDGVDKLLRRVAGCSYNKYRNGAGYARANTKDHPLSVKLDSNTRDKLKIEIVKHIDQLRLEYETKYKEEKETLMLKYKKECKQWEDKYKALKRENKKRKLQNNIKKQKSEEKPVGGCKFWSLSSWTNPIGTAYGYDTERKSYCNPNNAPKERHRRDSRDLSIAEVQEILSKKSKKKKQVRFVVPDDSDEGVNVGN